MPASHILTSSPYPFAKPAAQELHIALCELYPSVKAAIIEAEKIGIQQFNLDTGQSPYLLWADILRAAAGLEATVQLVQNVLKANPRSPRAVFLQQLLDGVPAPTLNHDSVKPRKTPEALLYHDDITLPIEDVASLILALEHMRRIAPSVCKLEVRSANYKGAGTAFRISPDLLLTNHHVLFVEGEKPLSVLATFGYEGTQAGTVVEFDPASVVAEKDDDWGVIKTKTPIDSSIPIVPLAGLGTPTQGAAAFVIQHPAGDRKRLAYARNRIESFDDEAVYYTSDTQPGSSGAPVFLADGRIIALHRAGGDPQESVGGHPIRLNEGVRISRVRQRLTHNAINL